MSKTAKDLLQEFQDQNGIEDDFQIHILNVVVNDKDEVMQTGQAQPVIKIEIDHDNRECLLHFEENKSTFVTVLDIKEKITDEMLDYAVCAAQEKTFDDSCVRIDSPLIGFGENFELKCFFAVYQS